MMRRLMLAAISLMVTAGAGGARIAPTARPKYVNSCAICHGSEGRAMDLVRDAGESAIQSAILGCFTWSGMAPTVPQLSALVALVGARRDSNQRNQIGARPEALQL